jgi:hypothetical protein
MEAAVSAVSAVTGVTAVTIFTVVTVVTGIPPMVRATKLNSEPFVAQQP